MNELSVFFLLVAMACLFLAGILAGISRMNERDDEEFAESLRRASEARLAQKSVPIMLRKQCD